MDCSWTFYLHVFLVLSVIGPLIVTLDSERESVLVNNGSTQTILERLLSSEEKAALELRILRLLGLPERPNNSNDKPIMKRSAPEFLFNVYKNDVIGEHANHSGEFQLNDKNLRTINQSDVIISFMAQQPHKGLGGKPDHVRRMWFDVSAVPVDDDIMMSAELKLYRNATANTTKNRGAFTITVYRVLRKIDGIKNYHFVDSVNISAGYTGWITLNVSETLRFWTQHPEENRGISISVTSAARNNSRKVRPENIGIIGFQGSEEKQPFMVGFYKNSGKRSIQLRINDIITRHRRHSVSEALESLQNYYLKINHVDIKVPTEPCELRTLYVNFKDIQWHDWIIAPSGFDAFYCSGECQFPLPAKMNATNHALIQNFMHFKQPDDVPNLCCAPVKYAPLSVIYFQDHHNVVLKKYQNMIVTQCGCL